MFSIAQINQSSSMFYNFSKNQIEWVAYKHNRNENHFCNDETKVFEICKQMQISENAKSYGNAKPIYLYLNDKLIKTF